MQYNELDDSEDEENSINQFKTENLQFLYRLQKQLTEPHKLTVQQASICISEPPDSPKSQKSQKSLRSNKQSPEMEQYNILVTQPSLQSLPTTTPPPSATNSLPPISITQSQSPPSSPKSVKSEEKERLLQPQLSQDVPTITEENHDQDNNNNTTTDNKKERNSNKLSLTLNVEQNSNCVQNNSNSNSNSNSDKNISVSPNPNRINIPERTFSQRKLSVQGLMGFAERRRSSGSIFSEMRKMSITNFDSIKSPGIGRISILFFTIHYISRFPKYFSNARNPIKISTILQNDKVCGVLGS
jgi:hypothetical protein